MPVNFGARYKLDFSQYPKLKTRKQREDLATWHAHGMEQLPGVAANFYSIAVMNPAAGETKPTRHYFILTDDPYTGQKDWTDFQQASAKPDFDPARYYTEKLTGDEVKPLVIPFRKDYDDFIRTGIAMRQDEKAGTSHDEALKNARENFLERQNPAGKLGQTLVELLTSGKLDELIRAKAASGAEKDAEPEQSTSPFNIPKP